MKKLILFPLLAGFCSCAAPQEEPQEIDVYDTGRIDLNRDGTQEQLVITSGGGTGGPVWYLARLSGEKISDEMQGRLWTVPGKSEFPDLLVRCRCGGKEYHTSLLRYNGERYQRISETSERKSEDHDDGILMFH